MQTSSPIIAEKRKRTEKPVEESSPKTPKIKSLAPKGVDHDAYQEIHTLIDNGSIVVNNVAMFNSFLRKMFPTPERRELNSKPRRIPWGRVDFDAQMNVLGMVSSFCIVVHNEENLIRTMEKLAPLKKTPERIPPVPDAPRKPEILNRPPRVEGDDETKVRRRLDIGVDDEDEDALDEDDLTRLDLINVDTIDVSKGIEAWESNPIVRAFYATIDALVGASDAETKMSLELIARSLIGVGTLEQFKQNMEEACGEAW